MKLYKGIEYEIKHVVAPRRGAWIETLRIPEHITAKGCRTPQGCVD